MTRWSADRRHGLYLDVREVLSRYARAVDRSDWAAMIETYHPDAVDDHGEFKGSREGLAEYLQQNTDSMTLLMHQLGNTLLLEVDDDRRMVVAETYCTGWMSYRAGGEAPAILKDALGSGSTEETVLVALGNRYLDVLCENDGLLQIFRRTVIAEWAQAFPAANAIPLSDRLTGADVPDDLSNRTLDELLA